jgi:transcriptional regulator with XRE-family HTH domain
VDILKLTGERIKGLVARRGYASIELFAHENRIAKSTMSEILNGKNDPKLSTLAKICAGLEISLSELFRDNGIDAWVREEAPDYDPREPRSARPRSGKAAGGKAKPRRSR